MKSNVKWAEYAYYLQIEKRITIPLAIKLLLFVLQLLVIVMASFLSE